MREVAHKILDALPSKAFAGTGWAAAFYAAVAPEKAKSWLDWLMSPEQVSFWGVSALIVFTLYWGLWWLLRPKPQFPPVPVPTEPPAPLTPPALAAANRQIIAVQMNDRAKFYNYGKVETQVFERPNPRQVNPAQLADARFRGVTFIVRPINANAERIGFARAICDAVVDAGGNAVLQDSYVSPDFDGIRLHAAPNETVRQVAAILKRSFADMGITADITEEMPAWGMETTVLIEIGAQ